MIGPIIIATLGDLKRHGYTVAGHCPMHGARPIDLDAMIARHGEGWRYVGRRWPIQCAECGADLSVTISPVYPPPR